MRAHSSPDRLMRSALDRSHLVNRLGMRFTNHGSVARRGSDCSGRLPNRAVRRLPRLDFRHAPGVLFESMPREDRKTCPELSPNTPGRAIGLNQVGSTRDPARWILSLSHR